MKPEFPFKRPVWRRWREATFEQIDASVWLIRGYYYRVCPECECECEPTDEIRVYHDGDRVRTYICRNCRLVFRYVMDLEDYEEKKPTPFTTPEVSPSKPTVLLEQKPERKHEESYHEEEQKEEVTIPQNLRYLLG